MRGYASDTGIPQASLDAAVREHAAAELHGAHLDAEEALRRWQLAQRAYVLGPTDAARAVLRLADAALTMRLSALRAAIAAHREAWGM
jgi:hypothetical protein